MNLFFVIVRTPAYPASLTAKMSTEETLHAIQKSAHPFHFLWCRGRVGELMRYLSHGACRRRGGIAQQKRLAVSDGLPHGRIVGNASKRHHLCSQKTAGDGHEALLCGMSFRFVLRHIDCQHKA